MENLTDKIKDILDQPEGGIRFEEAALVLLQINRNRILYENIVRRGNEKKLRYELQKIYDFRMTDQAAQETQRLEEKARTILTTTLPAAEAKEKEENKGRRADHDQLPEAIQALWLENQNLYPRMRKLHEQLKLMSDKLPCDRYPYLKELKELDEKIRSNWQAYDAFNAAAIPPVSLPSAEPEANVSEDLKKIQAARKYLSDNKARLAEYLQQGEENKAVELSKKMQERIDWLIQSLAGISKDQSKELQDLGLKVPTNTREE